MYQIQSGVLKLYTTWLASATPEQIEHVDRIYKECEDHYEAGGDTVVECFSPQDVLKEFKSVAEARDYCGLKVEQAMNARWGEDDDPELERMRKFDSWTKES